MSYPEVIVPKTEASAVRCTSDEPSRGVDVVKVLKSLHESGNQTARSVGRQVWHNFWLRDQVEQIREKAEDQPFLAKAFVTFVKSLPDDDLATLEEIRIIVGNDDDLPAQIVRNAVNDRLARSRERLFGLGSACVGGASFLNSRRMGGGMIAGGYAENYSGYLCTNVCGVDGRWLAGSPEQSPHQHALAPRTPCRLNVWLDPSPPKNAWFDEVLIETGQDADFVNFSVEVDCPTLPLPYGRKRLRVHRRWESDRVYFDFMMPGRVGEHLLYVQLMQGECLVQRLSVILKVEKMPIPIAKVLPQKWKKSESTSP